MAAARHYCSVCRSWYRGLGGIHDSTKTHRQNVYRREGRGSTKKLRRHTISRRGNYAYKGDDMVSVVKHRRSPPNDGTRKIVAIPHYWRREPYIANRAYVPKRKRRRSSSSA